MAKLIFHLGSHRTGSTHLQYNLALNRKYLATKGIKYFRFHEEPTLRETAILLRNNLNNTQITEKCRSYLKEKINELLKGHEYVILSYEGILGNINLYDSGNIYPNAGEIIKIYKEIFKSHEVIPVFAVREYSGFIFSTYKYEVKNGMPLTLSEYLANISIETQRWTQIINSLEKEFGEVKVWSFEEYKNSFESVLISIIELIEEINLDKNKLRFFKGKKNDSKSEEIVKLNYTINRILDFKLLPESWKKKLCRKINYAISRKPISANSRYLFDCFDTDVNSYQNVPTNYEEEIRKLKPTIIL